MAHSLAGLAADWGIAARRVSDAKTAIETLRSGEFDALISDVPLPDMALEDILVAM